jgi:hypothetical protein
LSRFRRRIRVPDDHDQSGAKAARRRPAATSAAESSHLRPELTLDLPVAVSAASGMNAIAHCAEAPTQDGNPIISLMAEEGIRALANSLPSLVAQPRELRFRSEALYGSWLAGMTIATTSVALHHKLCHVLGGFGLPHAETHSIVLPHALRYNQAAAPEAMARIEKALNAPDAAKGVYDLEKRLGVPMRLADIGMKEADLERAARIAVEAPNTPRKVSTRRCSACCAPPTRGASPRAARRSPGSALQAAVRMKLSLPRATSAACTRSSARDGWQPPIWRSSAVHRDFAGRATPGEPSLKSCCDEAEHRMPRQRAKPPGAKPLLLSEEPEQVAQRGVHRRTSGIRATPSPARAQAPEGDRVHQQADQDTNTATASPMPVRATRPEGETAPLPKKRSSTASTQTTK